MSWTGGTADPRLLAKMTIADFLNSEVRPMSREGMPTPRVAVFDQFEELFTFYPERWNDRQNFFDQLSEALERENKELTMKFGVANVLRQSAGDSVEREAAAHAPAAMGDVIWTRAGELRARWIAHAVAAIEGAVCLQRANSASFARGGSAPGALNRLPGAGNRRGRGTDGSGSQVNAREYSHLCRPATPTRK